MSTDSADCRLLAFYQELKRTIEQLANKHDVIVQPYQVLAEEDALHLSLTATTQASLVFYGSIWQRYAKALGVPDYLAAGMRVIDPDSGDEWTIIGLDPLSAACPVRLMDASMNHSWISIEQLKTLQPIT